jgi:SAM-dependent methyltransferase
MTSPFTYDFGYPWPITWIHLFPIALGIASLLLGLRFGWRRWRIVVAGLMAAWGIVGLVLTHTIMGGLNAPQRLPTDRFLESGEGRVIDVGAGSGRALIGLLLARPRTTGTALDIYEGFYGVADNTPERMLRNARIAGVAGRADVIKADATKMPLPDASYDAAISSYAVDHMGREGTPRALEEIARVLKPNGEFLLEIVNPDAWTYVMMPIPHVGLNAHSTPDPARWRTMIVEAGFEVIEEGTAPATRYWLLRKPAGAKRTGSQGTHPGAAGAAPLTVSVAPEVQNVLPAESVARTANSTRCPA